MSFEDWLRAGVIVTAIFCTVFCVQVAFVTHKKRKPNWLMLGMAVLCALQIPLQLAVIFKW